MVIEERPLTEEESCSLGDTCIPDITSTEKTWMFLGAIYSHLLNDRLIWEGEIILLLMFMDVLG